MLFRRTFPSRLFVALSYLSKLVAIQVHRSIPVLFRVVEFIDHLLLAINNSEIISHIYNDI